MSWSVVAQRKAGVLLGQRHKTHICFVWICLLRQNNSVIQNGRQSVGIISLKSQSHTCLCGCWAQNCAYRTRQNRADAFIFISRVQTDFLNLFVDYFTVRPLNLQNILGFQSLARHLQIGQPFSLGVTGNFIHPSAENTVRIAFFKAVFINSRKKLANTLHF